MEMERKKGEEGEGRKKEKEGEGAYGRLKIERE